MPAKGKDKQKPSASTPSTETVTTLANGRKLIHLDPNDIYFAHSRVRPVFTGCNKLIETTIQEIVDGVTTINDIPYITVIENIDVEIPPLNASNDANPRKKGNKKGQRGHRGDDDDQDEEIPYVPTTKKGQKKHASEPPSTGQPAPFYVSLNNRRLFMFKKLRAMGVITTIPVQLKPALAREKMKYTKQNCSLNARLMGKSANPGQNDSDDAQSDADNDDAAEDAAPLAAVEGATTANCS